MKLSKGSTNQTSNVLLPFIKNATLAPASGSHIFMSDHDKSMKLLQLVPNSYLYAAGKVDDSLTIQNNSPPLSIRDNFGRGFKNSNKKAKPTIMRVLKADASS